LRYINDPFDTKHCGAHHQESAKGNYEARSLIVSAAVLVLTQPLLGRGSDTFNKNATESHIFHANCAVCHGMDGAESQAGKSLHAPDLRTNKIQMQSDATIARFINEGNGSMPSFKESLKR
jgi:mono/diheme cytochrome c family protein